jgi:hypothetical protein
MFVDIDQYITNHENAFAEGTAHISDIQKCCSAFLAKNEQNEL